MTPEEQNMKIVEKFEIFSDRYHKMSLIFYELSLSLRYYAKTKNVKEFRKYLKDLNIDYKKVEKITKGMSNLKMEDIQNDRRE